MTGNQKIPPSARRGPLGGIRVLDISSVIMGPYATQMLGDLGADVIVVEPIEGGKNRGMGPGRHPQFSGIALNLLRNKRSVALNLKDASARTALLRIAQTCDVLVTNMRPKALRKLGIGYEDLREVRPNIIYCQAQGFRGDSPRADDPAYDDIIQAESGVADAARRIDGTPRLAPTIMADKVCGMAIANAVMAALFHRERTGEGQRVEVPMIDVMTSFMLVEHGAGAVCGMAEGAGYSRVLSPERGPQRTADGWINILPYSTAAYDALFAAGGREDLIGDPRTKGWAMMLNADFLYSQLRPIVATRTTAEWMAFCARHQIPAGTVPSLDEIVSALPMAAHPVAGSYRTIPIAVQFSATQSVDPTPAPLVGENTRDVLEEAGLSGPGIDELFQTGAACGAQADAAPAGPR